METIKLKIGDAEIQATKEEITQSIEKGEFEVKLPEEFLLFKKEDYDKRVTNEKNAEYKKGRKDGLEIEAKEIKRKLGLETEGKDFDAILSDFKEKILADHKIEPTKALEEKNKTIKQLQDNLKALEEEKNTIATSYSQKEKENKINSLLFSIIPDKAVSEQFTRNDIVALFKANGYAVDIQEDKAVALFNGEVIKHDKTLDTINPIEVVNKFVADKGLIKKEAGRGGSDNPEPSKGTSLDAFIKEMEGKNIKYGSQQYFDIMKERISNKTLQV